MLKPSRFPSPAASVASVNVPVPGVAEQAILADRRDEDVLPAVVVEVGGGGAHPVQLDLQSGRLGHIGEPAGALVAIEPREGPRRRLPGPRAAVYEQEVLPAVVVVVEECRARAERLGQELLPERAVVVREGDAGAAGDVDETKGRSRLGRNHHRGGGHHHRDGPQRPQRHLHGMRIPGRTGSDTLHSECGTSWNHPPSDQGGRMRIARH